MNHGGDGRLSKSIFAHEPFVTSETRLWRGVLNQAYADAELPLGPEAEDELSSSRFARAAFFAQIRPAKKKNCGSSAITQKFPSIAS